MTPWTHGEIHALRRAREQRVPMRGLMQLFTRHTRDEIVEAIDATMRHPRDLDAIAHVNFVQTCQTAGMQLINGVPRSGRVPYGPMF